MITRQECIEAIEAVNMYNHPITVFEDLQETVRKYSEELADELTEDYHYEDLIVDVIHNTDNLRDIQDYIENIDPGYGIYYDDGWGQLQDADLEQLKYDILDALRNSEDDENEEPEDESVDNNEEEWVEEDDDFITRSK